MLSQLGAAGAPARPGLRGAGASASRAFGVQDCFAASSRLYAWADNYPAMTPKAFRTALPRGALGTPPPGARTHPHWVALTLALSVLAFATARAELQFDVFLGYENTVREASWFPVAFEVFNDGPSFNAVVEFTSGQMGAGQLRQFALELPTHTRKRFVLPVFSSGGRFNLWNARLLDEKGKVRAERTNLRGKDLTWQSVLLGGLPRSFGGMPGFPQILPKQPELQPLAARMQVELFPDNPIALEALDALYLNSEKALELKEPQAAAILAWLHAGGHLIVAVEQPQDLNATQWLRQLLPCVLREVSTLRMNGEFHQWLRTAPSAATTESAATAEAPAPVQMDPRMMQRYGLRPPVTRPRTPRPTIPAGEPYIKLPADDSFDQAELLVVNTRLLDGYAELSAQGTPLIINAPRGRGTFTLLTFSPEREPFRSWKNKSWFWAKLVNVPAEWFVVPDFNTFGGLSIDGVFGAMLETKQVRKLPVGWLLVLLVVYLLVIGPVDQYCLKKLNRQMLTWITFPAYVVLFSLLIYFIGYKLRAGETEWNQLDVVDVLPRGESAELRGRTYVSLYSSANATYKVASDLPHATLRSEFLGSWAGQESGRATVEQRQAGFRGSVFVPVWLSQLFVSDWWQSSAQPLAATITPTGTAWQVKVENKLNRPLTETRLVIGDRIFEIGELQPGETKTNVFERERGMLLRSFVQTYGGNFAGAAQMRQQALGDSSRQHLDNVPLSAVAASFVSQLDGAQAPQRSFITPAGYDLGEVVARGDAVLLAWDAGHTLSAPFHREFTPPRLQRQTLLRLAVQVGQTGAGG
jgi:hypothetical protein